jgi:hypothetical protein
MLQALLPPHEFLRLNQPRALILVRPDATLINHQHLIYLIAERYLIIKNTSLAGANKTNSIRYHLVAHSLCNILKMWGNL